MTDVMTLIFDTETNGLRPKGRNISLKAEPALVQIAAILYWNERPVAHCSFFTQPLDGDGNAAIIPKEKFFIDNGITQETVDRVGTKYKVALAIFNNMVKRAERVVAHNIEFDNAIIRAAYSRINRVSAEYDALPKYCTMRTLTPILKLPGRYGDKFPTLDEAYRGIVDSRGFEGAHDAMTDVSACSRVLFEIEKAKHKLWKL